LGVLVLSIAARAAEEKPSPLEARLAEIATSFPGTIGVFVRNLESGEEARLNAEKTFPMASVYKIPIMVQVFRDAEAGKISLDERIELRAEDRRPGSGLLRLMTPGLKPTVSDLLYFMITISDNEATDLLLGRVGADKVTASIRALGIADMSVDRPTQTLIQNWLASPNAKFIDDKRDQASPRAMVDLLTKIHRGEAAAADSCKKMIDILKQQQFRERIPRHLPPTVVAHKTGTIGFTTNDAGIMTVGSRHVALAIFTLKGDLKVPTESAQETIGLLARAVYDYFDYRR
jgi:beta-lactamase class A